MNATTDKAYKYNLAIALGIIGDARALPTLRDIVNNRDDFYFKDSRRSNQFRSAIALCLIGRLGDVSDLKLLYEIAFDENEIKRQMYHTLKPDYLYYVHSDKNFVYYEMFTHAVTALLKIHKRCGISLDKFRSALLHERDSGSAVKRIIHTVGGSAHTELCDFLDYVISATE